MKGYRGLVKDIRKRRVVFMRLLGRKKRRGETLPKKNQRWRKRG